MTHAHVTLSFVTLVILVCLCGGMCECASACERELTGVGKYAIVVIFAS